MFEKYENKGLTGLANLGNTCYMNSCLQILSHTYELNELINNLDIENKLNNISDSLLLLEWKKLYDLMWSDNCTIAPYGFLKAVQSIAEKKNNLFTGFNQNDLPEFLIFLIDCFHNSLRKEVSININGTPKNNLDKLAKICYKLIKDNFSKNYSEIISLFNGISVTQILDLSNNALTYKPETFFIISLPIPEFKKVSIFDCFDLYCNKELLNGENAWFNEEKNLKEDVYKNTIFWNLPKILIIDFKRYTYNGKKIQTLIDTPINNVDFSKYVNGYNKETYIYELFAICNHSGNIFGGHYTCFIKNANNKWYEFNDTQVKEVSENNIITPRGYCFFYRKIK